MKRLAPAFILALAAIGLVVGIAWLFELRFAAGDVYPPYSSLRSDPLGTMAFYESLEQLPGLSLRRDYSTSNVLPNSADAVYLHLAASMEAWRHISEKDFAEIDRFVNSGGRLVIAMFPTPEEFIRPRSAEQKKQEEEEKKNAEEDARVKDVSIVDHWGLNATILNLSADAHSGYQPAQARNVSNLPLPPTLAWHSGMVFSDLNQEWKAIFMRDANPVIVERQFGRGSVVVASDSFFLSNEAMRNDRHADLLAWLVGPHGKIIFDEAHLGVTESANIAVLVRRYRLYWMVASLILLAGLFVWNNAFSLIPISEEERKPAFVMGKEAGEGFVNLLRRSIPAHNLLATCFKEWKKSMPGTETHVAARRRQAEAAFESENAKSANERDPVQAYRTISTILKKRTI